MALLALVCGVLVGAAGPAIAQVPPPVQRLLDEAGIPSDGVGLVVAPLQGGPRHLAHRADTPLQPGSTMKLVTTLVALERLGPAWRGRTRVLAAGPVEGGVLEGDLVLQGGADMDLSWQALQGLLRQLRERGIREIRGDLVLDRSAFRPSRLDRDVPPFDEGPEFEYNVIPDALLVDANLLRVTVRAEGASVSVAVNPPLHGVSVRARMTVVDAPCSRWGEGWQPPQVTEGWFGRREVVLQGTWPQGCERSLALNLLDRDEFTARLVRALWEDLGGRWLGDVREAPTPPSAALLAERTSRPLSELVRAINKPSDNALSRMLLLALGRESPGGDEEATLDRAARAVRSWFTQRGLDIEGMVLDNGSGLSREERLTPAQLEAVVRAGWTGIWAPEFAASLPIVGVDGTMRLRGRDLAPGQARLKTGTLRNVVALAGVVHDAAGRPMVVVVMLNHERARPVLARPIADALVRWVATTDFAAAARAAPGR